jgi:hypothetical protein
MDVEVAAVQDDYDWWFARVIGHCIGGKHIPTKWRVSLRPDAGVSDDGLVCHHPILRPLKLVMALRSKYVDAMYYEDILANS